MFVYNTIWLLLFAATKLTAWNILLPLIYTILLFVVYKNNDKVTFSFKLFGIHVNAVLKYEMLVDIYNTAVTVCVATTVLFYSFYFFAFDAIAPRYPMDNKMLNLVGIHLAHIVPLVYMLSIKNPTLRHRTVLWGHPDALFISFAFALVVYQYLFYRMTGIVAYPFIQEVYNHIGI